MLWKMKNLRFTNTVQHYSNAKNEAGSGVILNVDNGPERLGEAIVCKFKIAWVHHVSSSHQCQT